MEELPADHLATRRLLRMRTGLVASPDYLDRRGRPRRVADLARHDLLVQRAPGRQARWPLIVLVDVELASGALEAVLPNAVGRDTDGLHLVYPQGRLLAAKVRAFIDFAITFFADRQV